MQHLYAVEVKGLAELFHQLHVVTVLGFDREVDAVIAFRPANLHSLHQEMVFLENAVER
jgi:hypothetical protein